MYDADHSYESHFRAITYVWPYLALDGAVLVVDDWNYPRVRQATLDGLQAVDATIWFRIEIMHPNVNRLRLHEDIVATGEFWNGIGIFIVS
jgi:hypothetical protein